MLRLFNCFGPRKSSSPREYKQTRSSCLQSVKCLFSQPTETPSGSVEARSSITFTEPISEEAKIKSGELLIIKTVGFMQELVNNSESGGGDMSTNQLGATHAQSEVLDQPRFNRI